MTEPVATSGCFSDFRLIKGRKVAQIVIEVPIEQADQALAALGGLPQPAEEKWVAIARLETRAKAQPLKADTKLSFEAVRRCRDREFQLFLGVEGEEYAAAAVKAHCHITGRSGLNTDPVAASLWRGLDGRFQAWKKGEVA